MYTVEIKLVPIQTTLLLIKVLIAIPRETINKINLKYIIKEMTQELKLYTIKIYLTQKKAVVDQQKNKRNIIQIKNKEI